MKNLKIWDKEYGILDYKGKIVVSSKTIADVFDKRHDHVLRDIDAAIQTIKKTKFCIFSDGNIFRLNYRDKQNRQYIEYMLTKDGFAYIAMGFTGERLHNSKSTI